MACTGCGTSTCRGCKDMKIILPEANGISSVTDNGDGTFTIVETNGTSTIITTATPPNDAWVEFDETTVTTSPTYTGSAAITGSVLLDGAYKVLNIDTVFIRCQARITATVAALTDSINFNFDLGTITSNWYASTKLATMVTNSGTVQGWVPISIISTTSGAKPNNIGRAYAVQTPAPDGLIAVGNTNLQMPNGAYDFIIDFEMTAKLV